MIRRFLLQFAILAALAFPAFAQLAGSATITGTLTDPSAALVPGASVTVRNTDTGIERRLESNEAGHWAAPFLPPGHYEVRAGKAGFAGVIRKNLVLQVGQTLTVDLPMSVQASQTEVTVTGEAPLVDNEKTEMSQVISESSVRNLPIAGRRWDSFVMLTPNVTSDGGSGLVSFRGISGIYNSNTVDGANNNQALFSEARGRALTGVYVYSMDSIREYQVSSSNYSAELGQAAGGVVNAVTKSGANDFHGDLFYFLRYPTFNALDPFPKSQGIYSQAIRQWQQFGGSIGGRLIKDRLFYFMTYDGSRKVNPVTYTSSSYNARVRALPCPAQVSGAQCADANAFLSGQLGSYPRASNQDVGFFKLDGQANARNHISTSFNMMNGRAPNAYRTAPSYNNEGVSVNGSYGYHERIFVANWDSSLSSSAVNNFRFQWGRDLEVAGSNAPAPYVSIASVMNYGENYALPRIAEPDETRIQLSDTFSKTRGRHTFKTGVDVNIIHEIMINLYNGPGQYNYSGAANVAFSNWVLDMYGINTGDGLTGRHFSTLTQVNDPLTGNTGKDDYYQKDFAAFFEDSWKATPKLTFNLGVRYDLNLVPQPPKPNTLTPLTTLYTSTINIDTNNFAPRLGMAWQPGKGSVVRAAYGMFYAKTGGSTFYAQRVENGVYQQSFNCTPTTCPALSFPNLIFPAPGPPLAAPFQGALTPRITPFTPPSLTQLARGLAPDFVPPMVHEGEVTYERQLPGSMSASAAYVFTRGMHLPMFVDTNLRPATGTRSYDVLSSTGSTAQTITMPWYTQRPDATGVILTGFSDVNSWYNSMVLTLRRRMTRGFEFTANYTLSRSTDGGQVLGTNGGFNGTDYAMDPMNRKLEYGRSDFDQRHRFVASAVWMPEFRGLSNAASKFILNGWAFSTIVTESTGQPVTPAISGNAPGGLDGGLTGAVVSNGGVATGGRAPWIGRAADTTAGYHSVDLRIGRQFSFGERLKLQLLGEAFNLFNQTNIFGSFSVNNTAFNFAAAGGGACAGHANGCLVPNAAYLATTNTSTLTYGPRQLQISGKITF